MASFKLSKTSYSMHFIFYSFQTYRPVIIDMDILKMLLNLPYTFSQSIYEV